MKRQEPALGILQDSNWEDFKTYRVSCECTDSDHDHRITVEYDRECDLVNVTIDATVTTPFWSMDRWKQIWQIFTQGYVSCQSAIIMNRQQALNYAKALEDSVNKMSELRKNETN